MEAFSWKPKEEPNFLVGFDHQNHRKLEEARNSTPDADRYPKNLLQLASSNPQTLYIDLIADFSELLVLSK